MRRRPTLKPGDVCKISKRSRSRYNKDYTYIVKDVQGDGAEGKTRIRCVVIPNSNVIYTRVHQLTLNRRALWFTGYNQNQPETRGKKAKSQSSKSEPICICPYQVLMSRGCKCGAITPYNS